MLHKHSVKLSGDFTNCHTVNPDELVLLKWLKETDYSDSFKLNTATQTT